jgi:hypothetical protein
MIFCKPKNICLIIVGLFLFCNAAQAQKFFPGSKEIGFMIGGSNYHGDLAREIVLKETKLMLGAYYEQNFNEWVSARYQFCYGRISGSDDNFSIYNQRNLNFYSDIYEGSATLEFNFFPFGLNPNLSSFSSYTFIGLGMFYFNPKTKYGDEVVSLRDLGTEGQGFDGKKKYSLLQPTIPMGVGIKVKQSSKMVIGLEVGFRKTFTDYLDDVKGEYPNYERMLSEKGPLAANLSHRYLELNPDQPLPVNTMRGDPHLNDWYFFMNLRIAYKFGRPPCPDNFSF